MKKFFAVLALTSLISLALVSLAKEVIVRRWLEEAFRANLSLEVQMQEVYVSLLSPRLAIDGLFILNPTRFGRHNLAHVPEVVMEYDLPALFKRHFRVKKMTLDILEINMVRDASGEVNLNSIRSRQKRSKATDLRIEDLDLSVRRVTFQDLGSDAPVKVYDLNLRGLQFKNIETLEGLCHLITLKIFERIGLNQLGVEEKSAAAPAKGPRNPVEQAGTFLEEVIRSLRSAIPA